MDLGEIEAVFRDLEDDALIKLKAEGMTEEKIEYLRSIDICFEGQRYYIDTPIPNGELTNNVSIKTAISDIFRRLYNARYGHLIDAPLKTINLRLKAVGRIEDIPVRELEEGKKEAPSGAVKKSRQVFLDGKISDAQIYERAGLLAGNVIQGPAVIEEPFHVTVVMPDQELTVDKFGNLIIKRKGS